MNQQHGAVLGWATGKVQAVWFRAFVCEQAQRYHLTGYANNLSDGRVEMLLQGDMDNIERVKLLVAQGPELANVESVVWQDTDLTTRTDFTKG